MRILLINIGVALLIISPFIPGPPNSVVNLIYNGGQILGLLGLVIIPVGLIWTIRELRRRKNDNEYQVDKKAIIVLAIPLTIFLTSIYIAGFIRDFSRGFAIDRTEDLIESIERCKEKEGRYPDSLAELTPKFIGHMPSPFIMGIDKYYYEKQGETYNISFYQNVLLSFNFEVVTYDPTDSHKAEGELTTIYDAGKIHWRYFVYD